MLLALLFRRLPRNGREALLFTARRIMCQTLLALFFSGAVSQHAVISVSRLWQSVSQVEQILWDPNRAQ